MQHATDIDCGDEGIRLKQMARKKTIQCPNLGLMSIE